MIPCTSYFLSYNPLIISGLSVQVVPLLPPTHSGLGAPPCGQQQEFFPSPHFFPLGRTLHLGFLVLLIAQLI